MKSTAAILTVFLFLPLLNGMAGTTEHEHHCSTLTHFYSEDNGPVLEEGLLAYDVSHYEISLEVNDTSTWVKGYTGISATSLKTTPELVFQLSDSQVVDSVMVEGKTLINFYQEDDLLRITVDPKFNPGEKFKIIVWYEGFGGSNSFFAGISNRRDQTWGKRVTYTLSEPFRARDWYVCKQVAADKADSADIFITVADNLKAGSNGVLLAVDSLPGNKLRYHWQTRHPIAYYLLSLSVSEYQDYSFYMFPGEEGDSILIQNYIYNSPGCLEQNKENIDASSAIMNLYSSLFMKYPYADEKYGHCLAPMGGGMEHQTMTTISHFGFSLVAHELAHQWFGNFVTSATWQDIWVNEGFASYAEYLALQKLGSGDEADRWMSSAHDWALSEPEGSVYVPEAEAGDEFRIFSRALSYKKGASLLHMIRYELGNDEMFFEVLRTFLDRYKESVATGDDFAEVLSSVSGRDFTWFFEQWYYGRGFPEFRFIWDQSPDTLHVSIFQEGSSDSTPFFRTQLDLKVNYADGTDTVFRLRIEQAEINFSFSTKAKVENIEPDPYNWILDKSLVQEETVSNGYFNISPNPFGDELNIYFLDGRGKRNIILSDLSGKIMERKTSSAGKVTLRTGGLNQGLYLLQVMDGHESYSARVVRY